MPRFQEAAIGVLLSFIRYCVKHRLFLTTHFIPFRKKTVQEEKNAGKTFTWLVSNNYRTLCVWLSLAGK